VVAARDAYGVEMPEGHAGPHRLAATGAEEVHRGLRPHDPATGAMSPPGDRPLRRCVRHRPNGPNVAACSASPGVPALMGDTPSSAFQQGFSAPRRPTHAPVVQGSEHGGDGDRACPRTGGPPVTNTPGTTMTARIAERRRGWRRLFSRGGRPRKGGRSSGPLRSSETAATVHCACHRSPALSGHSAVRPWPAVVPAPWPI
jgi:hypothetical protein